MNAKPLTVAGLLLAGSCGLSLAGCGMEAETEPPPADDAAPVAEELPPIEVLEGDGLPEALPSDLTWLTNDADPEYASPDAVRGGTLRSWMSSFPLTLRRVGPDSNGAFAGYLRYNQMGPVSFHPQTRRPIPTLATHWAFGADGRSVYFKLNPAARWSDGVPITAADYVFSVQFHRSKSIVGPWYNNHYRERIRDLKRYDDYTIGVQGADAKPEDELLYGYAVGPQPRHFHVLNENWVTDYNWRVEPNTGPYQIGKVEKGKFIELHRKPDWWANDLRYFRHRFNPDKIRVRVIRDINVAFQHFRKGELDVFAVTRPRWWHDKASGDIFDNGYVHKYWYYNDLPAGAGSLTLNTATPLLANADVRFGLAHAMHFKHLIATVFRGDYQRLPTFQLGFGAYDNHAIAPRVFDLQKAGAHFDAAGFGRRAADGIRVREDGTRLAFRVTYTYPDDTERLVVLKEEAKKAGVDLELQLVDGALGFKQMLEKKHEIAWITWNSQGLSPRYWEFFHSDNANKPQNNNFSNFGDPLMDERIMAFRASAGHDERVRRAHELEQMVHDSGVIIPTILVPFVREAAWRWMKLPAKLGTRASGSLFNSQANSAGIFSSGGLFWIDEEEKERTLRARDEGQAFEPVTIVDTTHQRG